LRLSLLLFLLASVVTSQVQDADTLLLAAARDKNSGEGLVADLLAKGANVNARDPKTGATALIIAAQFGSPASVKALVAKGADVNATTTTGATALFAALYNKPYIEIVKDLIAAAADVNARTSGGTTPLMLAVRLGEIEAIKALLAAGADVNAKANDGGTAYRVAFANHRVDVAEILVAAGAEVRKPDPVNIDPLVQLSRLTRRVDPEYSGNAPVEPVKFQAVIGGNGSVKQLVLLSGPAVLEEPARRAATEWKFEPFRQYGEDVEVATTLIVDFRSGTDWTDKDPRMAQVAKDLAQVKPADMRKRGLQTLERAVSFCSAAEPPNDACADADNWYGMALQSDHRQETFLKVEPFYLKALELRVRSPHIPASMALSLELEGMAVAGLFQAQRAQEMFARARELRAMSVKAMNSAPQDDSAEPPATVPGSNLTESTIPNSTFRVGGGVSPPSVTYKVDPEYSDEARLVNYSGTVLLSVVVDTEGKARSIALVKGLGLGLDERAVAAVRQWRFKPGTKDGHPVNVRARIEVNFKLL